MRDYFESVDVLSDLEKICINCIYFYCSSEKGIYADFPCSACVRDNDSPCFNLPISEE